MMDTDQAAKRRTEIRDEIRVLLTEYMQSFEEGEGYSETIIISFVCVADALWPEGGRSLLRLGDEQSSPHLHLGMLVAAQEAMIV